MGTSSFLQKLHSENRQLFYSFECLPVTSSNGSLLSLIESLRQVQPLFVSIPWHLKEGYDVTRLEPLKAAVEVQQRGIEALLHLATTGLTRGNVMEILKLAKEAGIRNIFALRGDRTIDSAKSDFPHACDLVRFIRKHFTNQFTICVGGYPTGHPESPTYLQDLKFLKEKVDAGADIVITQIFFDAQDFIKFESDCRDIGIRVPVIPGIMPIQSRNSLDKIIKLCKVKIPDKILKDVASMKDDTMVTKYGICKAVELVRAILESGTSVRAIHFFTLNRFHLSREVKKQIEDLYKKNFLN